MPRIPAGIVSESQLPQTGGIRGGVTPIPVLQEPGVSADVATLPSRAIAGLGQDFEQVGASLARAEAYRMQKTRAQDVMDSSLAMEPYKRQYEGVTAELMTKGDYRTLPQDVEAYGKQLLEDVSQDQRLTPQGKAMFRLKAEQLISDMRHNALGVQTQRAQQASVFATTLKVQEAQQRLAAATSPEELALEKGRFQQELAEFVDAGWLHGDVAGELYNKTIQTAQRDKALLEVRRDPMGSFNDLMKQTTPGGQSEREAFQGLPQVLVPSLIDDARQQMHQQAVAVEHQQKQDEAKMKHQQARNEITLRNDLYSVPWTPDNIPVLMQVQQRILDAGAAGQLGATEHTGLTNMAREAIEKARVYVPVSDPATKTAVSQRLDLATSQDEIEEVDKYLRTIPGDRLNADDLHTFHQRIVASRNELDPLNQPIVHQVKRYIMDRVLPGVPGVPSGILAQYMDAEEKTRLSNTFNAFDSWAKDKDVATVRRDGWTKGMELLQSLYDVPLGPPTYENVDKALQYLPLPLRRGGPEGRVVPNKDAARELLQELNLPAAERGRWLRSYSTWYDSKDGKDYIAKYYPKSLAQKQEAPSVIPGERAPTPEKAPTAGPEETLRVPVPGTVAPSPGRTSSTAPRKPGSTAPVVGTSPYGMPQ